MQVNTRAAHDAMVQRMSALSDQLYRLEGAITSGKRINTADDDPVGAARVLQINRTLAATASQRTGIDRASSRLDSADTTLNGISTLLQRVKEIALLGQNATLNADDRTTLANEVTQLSAQLLGYANTKDIDGGALFAGARTAGPAYAAGADGKIAWQGAGTAAVLTIDGATVSTGIDGPALFSGLPGEAGTTDTFQLLADLGAALVNPDAAARTASLTAAQAGVDASVSRTADTQAVVGTRMARLDTEAARLDAGKTSLTADLATTQGLEMADAIADTQRLLTVLQAAQLSFTKISSLSLWDMLR